MRSSPTVLQGRTVLKKGRESAGEGLADGGDEGEESDRGRGSTVVCQGVVWRKKANGESR